MNPKKAIEILSMDLTYSYPAHFDDLQKAINLGKEALGQFVILRKALPIFKGVLLPSETKE